MKFKITINDNEYHADMVDCDLVNQIADMCPFEVTFKQHRNQEYFTKLPSQANDGEFDEDVSEYLQEAGRNIFVEMDVE